MFPSSSLVYAFATMHKKKHFIIFFSSCVFLLGMKQIQPTPVKRLCKTHYVFTVNGQFPGPTLEVHDGDTLVIKATNAGRYNITLHW